MIFKDCNCNYNFIFVTMNNLLVLQLCSGPLVRVCGGELSLCGVSFVIVYCRVL